MMNIDMNHQLINITNEPKTGFGFIYLLCAGDKFKIGVTEQTIEKRIRDLQTGNPEEIWCRDYVEIPRKHLYDVEKMMHLRHHMKKIKNEWYDMSINDIKAFHQNVTECLDILNCINKIDKTEM